MDEQLVWWANAACGQWEWLDDLIRILESGRPFMACMACVLLLPLAFCRGRARRRWLAGLLAVGLTVTASSAAGRVMAGALPRQPRPLEVLELRLPHRTPAVGGKGSLLRGRPDTSRPSTHAILGVAAGLCLLWWRPLIGAGLTVAGSLLMITPVLYLGLHWPSDVVASLALAGIAGWCVARCRGRLAWLAWRLDVTLRRWPAPCALVLVLISGLLTWKATPQLGLMDAMTQGVRWVVSHGC